MDALRRLLSGLRTYKLSARLSMALAHGAVELRPEGAIRGYVLLSYITLPFTLASEEAFDGHTNRWECREIARIFLERGYAVDVIDWTNHTFTPRKPYAYCIDIHSNMERLAPLLPKSCIKIFHITGSHWEFQNKAEQARLDALKRRRGISLKARRTLPPSQGIDHADFATMLGNDTTRATYAHAKIPIFPIPLSTTHTFEFPQRTMESARTRFLWFGGAGLVHKGLDATLEAFMRMPEYHLTVCGPISSEKDFETAFHTELYETPNIHVFGRINPGSAEFEEIRKTHCALVHPSCSEGQSGAVITCMHAGLLPIVSRESGVDVDDFGMVLPDGMPESIEHMARACASMTPEELTRRAHAAWEYARAHHTRNSFRRAYRAAIDEIEKRSHGAGK